MIAAGAEFPVGFGDTGFPTVCVGCPTLFGDIVIAPSVVRVAIDIKPGRFPNSIKPRSKRVIPVAIVTTDTFDARDVDPSTVRFGPDEATKAHSAAHFEDVDGDGDLDLLLHFQTQETGAFRRNYHPTKSLTEILGTPFRRSTWSRLSIQVV